MLLSRCPLKSLPDSKKRIRTGKRETLYHVSSQPETKGPAVNGERENRMGQAVR